MRAAFTKMMDFFSSPYYMRTLNGCLVIFWIIMIPVSFFMGWLSSVVYVSALSLWALVGAHLAAWQSARVEAHQDSDADVDEVLAIVRQLREEYLHGDGDDDNAAHPENRRLTPVREKDRDDPDAPQDDDPRPDTDLPRVKENV